MMEQTFLRSCSKNVLFHLAKITKVKKYAHNSTKAVPPSTPAKSEPGTEAHAGPSHELRHHIRRG